MDSKYFSLPNMPESETISPNWNKVQITRTCIYITGKEQLNANL